MEQVFAELSAGHARLEILVRGRDHPHVDPDRELPTDAVELTLRKYAQQPRLQRRRHVADLVEEEGAAVGLLEPPAAELGCPGKCALLVTEELGLEQVGRKRRGVERNERLGGAWAVPVQRARDQFLARA